MRREAAEELQEVEALVIEVAEVVGEEAASRGLGAVRRSLL